MKGCAGPWNGEKVGESKAKSLLGVGTLLVLKCRNAQNPEKLENGQMGFRFKHKPKVRKCQCLYKENI